jgi:lipopolysaccharide transport system ATP-binding protein
LKDVSFKVNQGEVLGIIGRNAAGKSTVLKILSRVTAPTEGEARIKGRISSLLEVGTGFHPELTGRENIYLNGAILGMTKSEIRGKFDEIVAFSEVEQFIDTPVKRYSSGMYVRLAFAIAAHLEPEILIVDEVLAVGDAAFQQKCLGKMKDVAGEGRTILFVSHNMEAARRLCTRGIWLLQGSLQMDDAIDHVVDSYTKRMAQQPTAVLSNPGLGLTVFDIRLRNQDGVDCSTFRPGDDLIVELNYEAKTPIAFPHFVIAVHSFKGSCFAANMLLDGHRPDEVHGKGRIACTFKSIPLLPQNYTVQLAIRARNGKDLLIGIKDVAYFEVSSSLADYGYKGEFMAVAAQSTSVVVPYQWHLPDGTVAPVSLSSRRE